MTHYEHLGLYSDLVDAARGHGPLFPLATPGPETQALVRSVLGFCHEREQPADVRVERRWEADGVTGEEVSWSAGYGPRTHAYLLEPSGAGGAVPGVLALHDHGGFKYYGKEKIADGPEGPLPGMPAYRDRYYGGQAYPNALARAGFAVLAPDVFLWGSRRFAEETMPAEIRAAASTLAAAAPAPAWGEPAEVALYNIAAALHEHTAAKYCNLLGTSLAGVVSHEDRIAFNYLLSRPEVRRDRCGCIGLSGGGNRAALLNATHDEVAVAVIVGLMTTYEGLLDHNMSHTWMLFPHGWSRHGDWPDLAACRAPSPLLVQYLLDDDLFTVPGMRAADARLRDHYASVGQPDAYAGQFYPGPHRFDEEMQAVAFAWLRERLA